jgi:DMSO reductase anchor subunit
MHPEMSLVLLTVLAGAGQGVFIMLVVLDTLFSGTGIISTQFSIYSCIVAIACQVVGIIASTLHLGNPERGWRASLMVKNSWLSREVITLSAAAGSAVLYLAALYFGLSGSLRLIIGAVGVFAAIGFYISSSMVYASVSFIKEWANAFTPVNFFIFGITSGFAVAFSIMNFTDTYPLLNYMVNVMLIFLGLISFVMKLLSYKYNAGVYVSVNTKNAVGINDPDIKLMDMGTSYAHYNTKEYFHPVTEKGLAAAKIQVAAAAFIVPVAIWMVTASGAAGSFNAVLSAAAAISMIGGLILERRLFFIQGNNIQNLYYSNFRSTGAQNPLLTRARKGTPVPIR